MKKALSLIVILCMAFSLSACRQESAEVYCWLDNIAEALGNSQLTDERNLIGVRARTEDSYTGFYKAECDRISGRDVIFGGGSAKQKEISLSGHIDSDSGEAKVRIRMNCKVIELTPDENGFFEAELSFDSGGNYIMVTYDHFTGHVELNAEYSTNMPVKEADSVIDPEGKKVESIWQSLKNLCRVFEKGEENDAGTD